MRNHALYRQFTTTRWAAPSSPLQCRYLSSIVGPTSEDNAAAADHANTSSSPTAESSIVTEIPPSYLAFYWDLAPPSPDDLDHANQFFRQSKPVGLYVASKLHQVPSSTLPEVAFLGRSNVGKSSLLNALLGAPICYTSSKPGRTRALHAYAVGGRDDRTGAKGFLSVLDLPGYGHGSQAAWEVTTSRYLSKRKELRRVYVLIDAMHGIKKSDEGLLEQLRLNGISHQVIVSKVDRILLPGRRGGVNLKTGVLEMGKDKVIKLVQEVRNTSQPENNRQGVPALGEVLCVSTEIGKWKKLSPEVGGTLGISALRWSILRATGFQAFRRKGWRKSDTDIVIDRDR